MPVPVRSNVNFEVEVEGVRLGDDGSIAMAVEHRVEEDENQGENDNRSVGDVEEELEGVVDRSVDKEDAVNLADLVVTPIVEQDHGDGDNIVVTETDRGGGAEAVP